MAIGRSQSESAYTIVFCATSQLPYELSSFSSARYSPDRNLTRFLIRSTMARVPLASHYIADHQLSFIGLPDARLTCPMSPVLNQPSSVKLSLVTSGLL